MDHHQLKQIKVINKVEKQVNKNSLSFSMVSPVNDYENDSRIALTSVHLPSKKLIAKIQKEIIDPLKNIEQDYYYYPDDSLHMTIKNIRVINNPPHFTKADALKAKKVFSNVISKHKKFNVYFYRLLLFPNNLALIGTTDSELDKIHLELDKKLNKVGMPDDKKYANNRYFFSNMTLARFYKPSNKFKNKVKELSKLLTFEPYKMDSINLVTCNAVFKKRNVVGSWKLK